MDVRRPSSAEGKIAVEVGTNDVGQGPTPRQETLWEPVDMDPSSKSFRLKSVRRENPMNVANL